MVSGCLKDVRMRVLEKGGEMGKWERGQGGQATGITRTDREKWIERKGTRRSECQGKRSGIGVLW